jgi:endonuclease YncB( thermonuclease family)
MPSSDFDRRANAGYGKSMVGAKIDNDDKVRLLAYCASRNITVNEFLNRLIVKALDGDIIIDEKDSGK